MKRISLLLLLLLALPALCRAHPLPRGPAPSDGCLRRIFPCFPIVASVPETGCAPQALALLALSGACCAAFAAGRRNKMS